MPCIRRLLTFLLLVPALFLGGFSAYAQADLGAPQLSRFYGDSTSYTQLLAKYVDDKGLVDYAGLKQNRASLDLYLKDTAEMDEHRVHVFWPGNNRNVIALRNEQRAFLINVYNARVLQTVIDHYPLTTATLSAAAQTSPSLAAIPASSIRRIPGVFDREKFKLGGKEVTLDELKAEIHGGPSDPQLDFALSQGAVGSPPLRNEAYRGTKLQSQLRDQLERFIATPQGVRADGPNKIRVSPIFEVYFDVVAMPVEPTIKASLESQKKEMTLQMAFTVINSIHKPSFPEGTTQIDYLDFDWSLNEQPKK